MALPGPEVEGMSHIFWQWATNNLDGAPPYEMLSAGNFTVGVTTAGADSTTLAPGTVAVTIRPGATLVGACPPRYTYAPDDGAIKKLPADKPC